MGRAIETVSGILTAGGATIVTMPPVTGDSFTIRNSNRPAKLLTVWSAPQVAGALRLSSPLMHDTTNGLTFQHGSSNDVLLKPAEFQQDLMAQDTIAVAWSGSAVAGDIEHSHHTIYYPELPGIDGKFISSQEMNRRTVNLLAMRMTLTLGATGQYSGAEAINAESDTFKANTDYAIIGIQAGVASAVGMVGFRSPDWGNLRIGVPTVGEPHFYSAYFQELSDSTGIPLIPVFNSSNRSQTLIDACGNENAATYSMSVLLAELSRGR